MSSISKISLPGCELPVRFQFAVRTNKGVNLHARLPENGVWLFGLQHQFGAAARAFAALRNHLRCWKRLCFQGGDTPFERFDALRCRAHGFPFRPSIQEAKYV